MKECICREEILKYCEAIKALAEKEISEWIGHTTEYKERVSISSARQRKSDMEDAIRFIDLIPATDVRQVIFCKDCAVPHNKWTGCPKLGGLVTEPDFFCAFGKPKGETDALQ